MICAEVAPNFAIFTAQAASLMLSGCSSTSTQVLAGMTIPLNFPYTRHGGEGSQLPKSKTWLIELLRTRGSLPLFGTSTVAWSAGHFQTAYPFLPRYGMRGLFARSWFTSQLLGLLVKSKSPVI